MRANWQMMSRQVVYVQIPVNRGGVVDPPNVNWTEAKEEQLWKVLSKSKRSEVDWSSLCREFGVGVRFLQQQAYWLYEKQLEQLRNRLQMDSALSADTLTENNANTISQRIGGMQKPVDVFNSNTTVKDKPADVPQGTKYQSSMDDTSESEDESLMEFQQGSMLLHKSRILSRAPPQLSHLDDEEDDEASDHQTHHEAATDSNLSSVSISKSALEEALLDDSHF